MFHDHIREQQHIINLHHINNFLFDDDGARYVRQISCHNTSDRPLLDGYNVVVLYNSVVLFTPASPFDTLLQLTHVWYTVTNSQNSIFYFDLVPQLYNGVPIDRLARKIQCPYVGTYLLFSPDQNGSSTSPTITQHPPAVTSHTASSSVVVGSLQTSSAVPVSSTLATPSATSTRPLAASPVAH